MTKKSFDYLAHPIYASIGYLAVQAAYIENFVEEVYVKIYAPEELKLPIACILEKLRGHLEPANPQIGSIIDESVKFFLLRNEVIHGQIYGSREAEALTITHKRKSNKRRPFDESEVTQLIEEALSLRSRWNILRHGTVQRHP